MADLSCPVNQPLQLHLDKIKNTDSSSPNNWTKSVDEEIAETSDKDKANIDIDANKDDGTLHIAEDEALQAGATNAANRCEGEENKIKDIENVQDISNEIHIAEDEALQAGGTNVANKSESDVNKIKDFEKDQGINNETLESEKINNNEYNADVRKAENHVTVTTEVEDKHMQRTNTVNSESDENEIHETENRDTVNDVALEIVNENKDDTRASPIIEDKMVDNDHSDDNLGTKTSINHPIEDRTLTENEKSSNCTVKEATEQLDCAKSIEKIDAKDFDTGDKYGNDKPLVCKSAENENTTVSADNDIAVEDIDDGKTIKNDDASISTSTETGNEHKKSTETAIKVPTEDEELETENTFDSAAVEPTDDGKATENDNVNVNAYNEADDKHENDDITEAAAEVPLEVAVEPMDNNKTIENYNASEGAYAESDEKHEKEKESTSINTENEEAAQHINDGEMIKNGNVGAIQYSKADEKDENENKSETNGNVSDRIRAMADVFVPVDEDEITMHGLSKDSMVIEEGLNCADGVKASEIENANECFGIETAIKDAKMREHEDAADTKDVKKNVLSPHCNNQSVEDSENSVSEKSVDIFDKNLYICSKSAVAGSEMSGSPSVDAPKEAFDTLTEKLADSTGAGVSHVSKALPDITTDLSEAEDQDSILVIDESDDEVPNSDLSMPGKDLQTSTNKNKDNLLPSSNNQTTDHILPLSMDKTIEVQPSHTDKTMNDLLPPSTDQISDDVLSSSTDMTSNEVLTSTTDKTKDNVLPSSTDKTKYEILPASTSKTKDDKLLPSTNKTKDDKLLPSTTKTKDDKLLLSTNKTKDDLLPISSNKTSSPGPFDWSLLGVQRCTNCKFTTDDEELYKNHATTCTARTKQGQVSLSCKKDNPVKYTCNSCNISWVSKAEFEEHVVCHIVDSPYLCITCKRLFQSRYLIEKHAKTDHPLGDSKCALHGMKKCRQYVSAVENEGHYSFTGKLNIPRTPRNQIKDTQNVSNSPSVSELTNYTSASASAIISSEPKDSDKKTSENTVVQSVTTVVATMPSPRPDLVKFNSVASKIPEEIKLVVSAQVPLSSITTISQPGIQVNTTTSLATSFQTIPSTTSVTSLTTSREDRVNTLFQVLDSQNGQFHPATLPRKIQELVNATTSSSDSANNKAQTEPGMKEPQYHVKQFTEFTKPIPQNSLNQPPATLKPQSVFIIPIRPIIRLDQSGQQPAHSQTNTFTPVQSTISNPKPILNQPNSNQFLLFQSNPNIVDPLNAQPLRPAVPTLGGAVTTLSSVQAKTVNSSGPVLAAKAPVIHKPATVLQQRPPVYPKPDTNSSGQQSTNTHTLQQPVNEDRLETVVTSVSGGASTVISHKTKVNQLTDKDRTFTFRIKPQKGFVCECCKKYTRDELVFRKHVWEHFHVESMSCKFCKINDKSDWSKKGLINCKLVNEIVCKLVKNQNTINTVNIDENLVIDITGDDEDITEKETVDTKKKKDEPKAIEVIVLDDEDIVNDSDLNIKISATYSLTGTETLEKMSKDSNKSPDKAKAEAESPVTSNTTKHLTTEKEINDQEDMDTAVDDEDPETSETSLVDKTLGKKDVELDTIVSDTIDYIFGDTKGKKMVKTVSDVIIKNSDSKRANDEPIVESVCQEVSESNSEKKKSQNAESSDKVESMKAKFEAEILASQSHNAFYMCGYEYCHFSCLTSVGYKEHLQAKHTREFNYVCCHCGRKDYNEESHMRHVFSHASPKVFYLYQCPVTKCKFKTNLKHMYLEHLKKHEDLNIKCVYCHKIFSNAENLITHLNQNLLKFVSCPHCPFKFVYKQPVMKHIQLFHADKPRIVTVTSQIVCLDREINFYVEPLVKQTVDKDVAKTAAADSVNIIAVLDEAQKDNVERKEDNVNVTTITDDSSSKTLKSTVDSSIVKEKNLLIKFPAKRKTKSNIAGPKSLKCPLCSYLSYNLALHVQHTSSHQGEPEREKRFVCNLCPKGSENINQFKKHVANHIGRNEIKVFSCTSCMYMTNQKCHIMDHCSENHGGKGMYVQSIEEVCSSEHACKYCDFKARQYEHVSQHEEIVHRVKAGDHGADVESGCSTESLTDIVTEKPASSKSDKKKLKYHCEYCKNCFKHKADLKKHMEKDHADIEHKQFVFYKCKYCSHTSTMKSFIVAHIEKLHPGSELRILRKIESVEYVKDSKTEAVKEGNKSQAETEHNDGEANEEENIAYEKVGIPDGKIFKHPFPCPKCSFSSNLRIKVMRHIKCHTELVPVRESQLPVPKKVTKPTARKTTGGANRDFPERKHNALFQDVPSSYLHNPFTSLKDDVISSSNKESDLYILGEKELHAKLSACFIPFEKDLLFRCRICQQKIAKMFVLHRHILNHLEIVFFKCRYCDEGSIEKTLLFGHIQKEHPQKPLDHSQVSKEELDVQIKEKIFAQNFNDSVTIETSSEKTRSPVEMAGIIMKSVNENVPKVSDGQREKKQAPENVKKAEDSSKIFDRTKKCPHCRYTTKKADNMKKHIAAHWNPAKRFLCSICDYRGVKLHVVRHTWSVHGNSKCMVEEKPSTQQGSHLSRESSADTSKPPKTDNSKSMSKDSTEKRESSVSSVSSANSKNKHFLMKTLYKCKECGLCRKSVSGLYKHLKDSKACNRPVYKCSFCAFKSGLKTDVTKHRKIRHRGQTAAPIALPVKAKIRTVKIPILSKRITDDEEDLSPKLDPDSRSSSQEASSGIRCKICSHYCDTTMTLQFHINTAHGGKMLYCQECPYKTPLVKHMVNHCTNVHMQKEAVYKLQPKGSANKTDDDDSSIASSSLNEDSKKQARINEKFAYSCPKCDFENTKSCVFRRHAYSHFAYRPYQCQLCTATLSTFDSYKRHVKKIHPGKPLKYKFVRDEVVDSKVNKIMNQINKEKAKHDRLTGASRPMSLDKMELVETGVRKDGTHFYCDFCGLQYSKKSHIIKHYNKTHIGYQKSMKRSLTASDTEAGAPPKKMPKLEPQRVDDFDIRTSDSSDLEEESDLEKMLPVKYSVVMGQDGKRKFKCPQCDYQTDHKKYLQKHLKGHTSHQFKCIYCYFSSKYPNNTYRHIGTQHKGKALKIINMKTKQITSLKPLSPKGSPSVAGTSLKPSSTKGSPSVADYANVKPRQVNIKQVIYCCSVCTYKRKGLKQFRRHLAYHPQFTTITTRQRYNCGYCSYTASSNLDFSAHRLTHLEDRRFKCAYCDFSAFIRTVVLKHTNNAHGDKRETCIDRESEKIVNETLVHLDPKVILEGLKRGQSTKSKKFKRIKPMVENSSDESGDENSYKRKGSVNLMTKRAAEITKSSESENVTNENKSNLREGFERVESEGVNPMSENGSKEMLKSVDVVQDKGQIEGKTDLEVKKSKENDKEESFVKDSVMGLEDVEMKLSDEKLNF